MKYRKNMVELSPKNERGREKMELNESVARIAEKVSSIEHRLDNLEKLTESIQQMALSLERLTTQQSATEDKIDKVSKDVDEMKDQPKKRWDAVVAALIAGCVGAFIGKFIG